MGLKGGRNANAEIIQQKSSKRALIEIAALTNTLEGMYCLLCASTLPRQAYICWRVPHTMPYIWQTQYVWLRVEVHLRWFPGKLLDSQLLFVTRCRVLKSILLFLCFHLFYCWNCNRLAVQRPALARLHHNCKQRITRQTVKQLKNLNCLHSKLLSAPPTHTEPSPARKKATKTKKKSTKNAKEHNKKKRRKISKIKGKRVNKLCVL